MRGYKALNADMTAQHGETVYEVGKTYVHDGEPVICESGYHFCKKPADVFRYYPTGSRLFEVEAGGSIVEGHDKCVCTELTIVREVPDAERMEICNSGNFNSGSFNSGDRNSGDRNSGDFNSGSFNSGSFNSGSFNSGSFNSGNRNSGDFNSGSFNSGDFNSGNFNSGSFNSGDRNSGDRNSGDWNITDYSSGVLCTEEPECLIFDKPSGMTLREWRLTEAAGLMRGIEVPYPTWRDWSELTEEERELNKRLECQGGMLVVPENVGKPDFAGWWGRLTEDEKAVIKAIPNFDAEKWELITGIEVDE